jgi:hypothetical protein
LLTALETTFFTGLAGLADFDVLTLVVEGFPFAFLTGVDDLALLAAGFDFFGAFNFFTLYSVGLRSYV